MRDSGSDVSEGRCQRSRVKPKVGKEAGVTFRQFIRNRDHIFRRYLRERILQICLQFGIIRSRLLLDDVTLSLREHDFSTAKLILRYALTNAIARAAARPADEIESFRSAGPAAAPATKIPGTDVATVSSPPAPPASMKPYLFC